MSDNENERGEKEPWNRANRRQRELLETPVVRERRKELKWTDE